MMNMKRYNESGVHPRIFVYLNGSSRYQQPLFTMTKSVLTAYLQMEHQVGNTAEKEYDSPARP